MLLIETKNPSYRYVHRRSWSGMGGPGSQDGLPLREGSSQFGAAGAQGSRRQDGPSSAVYGGQRGYRNGVGRRPLASRLVSANLTCRPGRRGDSHVSTTVIGRGLCSSPECAPHAPPRGRWSRRRRGPRTECPGGTGRHASPGVLRCSPTP